MKISFVIPVYRNEGAIGLTHEKIKSVFASSLPDCQLGAIGIIYMNIVLRFMSKSDVPVFRN